MRKPLALIAIAGLSAAFASTATAHDGAVTGAKTKKVKVGDAFFKAKKIKVRKGTTVKWVWGSGGEETAVEHDVYSTKGTRLRSGFKTKGSYKKKITKTTTYLCRVHRTTMRGKIIVTK